MWLFTKTGFVSVVAYDPSRDLNKTSPFKAAVRAAGTHLLVRARIEADLDQLRDFAPSMVTDTDKSADYSFRAVVSREEYKAFLAASVDRITYDSHFKEAARDASPPSNGRYGAMMSVWSAMAKLQPYAPYGGWSDAGSNSSSLVSSSASFTYAFDDDPHTFGIGDRIRSETRGYGTVKEVCGASLRVSYDADPDVPVLVSPHFLTMVETTFEADKMVDLDSLVSLLIKSPADVEVYPLHAFDDDAVALLMRLGDLSDIPGQSKLNEMADEIRWERATPGDQIDMAMEGTVPEKYMDDAVALVGSLDHDH